MKFSAPGLAARSVALAAALLASTAPLSLHAQEQSAPRGQLSESVAAVVNDEIISTYDLAQRMRLLIITSGVQPTQETIQQFQREALISLVDEHLQLQELRRVEKEQKFEIIATDKEVDESLAELAKSNNLSLDQFLQQLASRGVGRDTLRHQTRAQDSWQRWIQGRYGSRLRIGEDQITASLTRLSAAAAKPQYEVSEVLIDASRVGGMQQATQGAQQLIGQMQQGAPFPSVARQFSALPTAASGGDAGWVSAGEMPPEVEHALEEMRPGQLSPPIPVKDGVYIVYLRDKRAGGAATMVSLKQAAVPLTSAATPADEETARAKLAALKPQIASCETLEATAGKVQGVVAGDLGEAEIADLAPQFQEAAKSLPIGQVSDPIRTSVGMHLVAVCGRRNANQQQLDRSQIERRLIGQQLSMIARRYMRDLRNSATIETR